MSEVLKSVHDGDNEQLGLALRRGLLPDAIDPEWNCTALFIAVLNGNLEGVRLLVEAGADVNAEAGEPGCDILASRALSLAMQCQSLLKDNRYDPIVELLLAQGASDEI